jgi:predicted enzyme related to lactoylglutathione lyase
MFRRGALVAAGRWPQSTSQETTDMNVLVNIDVDDLERAERFYREAFDLAVGRRFGAGAVELVGSGVPIYLLVKPAGTATTPANTGSRRYDRHWTPVHLDFVVDDIDGAVQRAIAAGAVQEGAVSMQPWGKLALLADPFGHGFCFLQFIGRGYDEIAD